MSESRVVPVESPLPKGLRMDLIACINCHNELQGDLDRLVCPRCSRTYVIIDGIPCFSEADVFYAEYASRSWIANAAYEVGFGAFHRTIERWYGRPSRAQFIHVVFEKSKKLDRFADARIGLVKHLGEYKQR